MRLIKLLIGLGVISLPLFVVPGHDYRSPKTVLMVALFALLSLLALYEGVLKPVRNPFVLLFNVFLLVSFYYAPEIFSTGATIVNPWMWKPNYIILLSTIVFCLIASIDISSLELRTLLTTMVYTALLIAFYCLFQSVSLDQIGKDLGNNYFGLYNLHRVAGTFGSPAIVSPFLAMIVPLALFLRKRFIALIISLAVILTQSQVAIGALIISLLFILATRSLKWMITSCSVFLIATVILIGGYFVNSSINKFIADKGRFNVVGDVYKDTREVNREFTGIGIGSFREVFYRKHNNLFSHAHNEYAELYFNTGLIGLFLFLCALVKTFCDNFSLSNIIKKERNYYRMCLLSSLLCISLCALGIFAWQIAPIAFYTIIVAGLLHNKKELSYGRI